MAIKSAVLLFAILAGCLAFPAVNEEPDMSIFFEHVDLESRIVGGTVAANGAHPHMGALTTGGTVRNYLCGSSIITRRTLLTAAHCVAAVVSGNTLLSTLRVTVGTNRWNSGGQMYAFQRHVNHPNYHADNIKNDIGMLITSTNIIMSNLVRVIPRNYAWVGAGVNTRVAGWGRTWTNGAISVNLLQLNAVTVDGSRCTVQVRQVAASLNMRAPGVDPRVEICAFHSRNHGTCNGDSGSALVRTDRGEQIGIVSWGLPCAHGAPDMFTRLSEYRAFVQANVVL